MKSSNVVVLSGNLTADPESFSAGCNLRLAVNMREKDGDDWKDRASFFDITVFGKQADTCMEHLAKGRGVIVEGQLRQDRWTNDNGDNRSKVKVIARNVVFVGGKPDSNGARTASPDPAEPAEQPASGSDDDIPF
jgi:single-strand DNA-binding protein